MLINFIEKMLRKNKQFGITLTEMVVVIATIAILATFGLPAARSLLKSFESGSGTKSIIDAALSTARAIAIKEQRYAGIRFELDIHDNQYMIFIIHDPEKTGLSSGFCALDGQKPIKLPDDSRVIDRMIRSDDDAEDLETWTLEEFYPFLGEGRNEITLTYESDWDGQNEIVRDMSCFSVIFSPTGKLVTHTVRVRNRDGIYKPNNAIPGKVSMDDIFNSPDNILNFNVGMFAQDDDWPHFPFLSRFGVEYSRTRFYIYEKSVFDKLNVTEDRYNYFISLKPVYINQYTGTIIDSSL